MGPRLRELTPTAAARGSQETGFTQPRAHLIAKPIPIDAEVQLERNQKLHIITKVHFQTTDHDVAAVGSLPLEEDIASIYKVNDLFYNNKFDEVMEVTAVQ